jgi:hypothetical protein
VQKEILELPSSSSPDTEYTLESSFIGSGTKAGSSLARVGIGATAGTPATKEAMQGHLEQVRLLIIGMEKRLSVREEALNKAIARAEGEGKRFEDLGQSVVPTRA